ncbi:MAG TPA: EamA family transporter RarD [Anaeromyxobacter sp.]|nr:EamA family transporter RarD [Anaeromyxobacter sp.]
MLGRSRGFGAALLAYAAWGFFPLYFKALPGVPAFEVLAHRILWSLVLLCLVSPLLSRFGTARHALGKTKRLSMVASALLLATNWVTYIWAVQEGRVVEASLGYFVNPLLSVLLGVVFLRERLRRPQLLAIALAAVGIVVLIVRLRALPWLPFTLALSFGLYGLVRKRAGVDPIGGLLAETAILAPLALGLVLFRARAGVGAFGHDLRTSALLAAAGPITTVPLVWFAVGVRQLPLSTVGILQYLTPTLQFLLGALLYREPFGPAQALAFAFIWAGLAIYTFDFIRTSRPAPPAAAAVPPLEGRGGTLDRPGSDA